MTDATEWLIANTPDENLIWKNGCAEQVIFVRDVLHHVLVPDYDTRKADPVQIVSSHRSKSVTLPVFELTTPGFGEGGYESRLRMRLRSNFHNWVVSVETTRYGGVADWFKDLFDREARTQSIYAEGFREEWVFDPYAESREKFTVTLYDKHEVYLFAWLARGRTR